MRYCFDLDETLCLTPASRDYSKAVPIWPMINDVNMLYEEGHEIWVFTTRGSTSGIDHHELNLRQLAEWGVKHHHLVDKGKPPVDFFIDDKAINVKDWRSQRGFVWWDLWLVVLISCTPGIAFISKKRRACVII